MHPGCVKDHNREDVRVWLGIDWKKRKPDSVQERPGKANALKIRVKLKLTERKTGVVTPFADSKMPSRYRIMRKSFRIIRKVGQ